jgi:hypothetical protein
MSIVIVAVHPSRYDVLDFTTTCGRDNVALLTVSDDMGQDERDQLAMQLQTLQDAGDIDGWGDSDTCFVIGGETFTLAEMVEANITAEDDCDWITNPLLSLAPGETGRVDMMEVTRL